MTDREALITLYQLVDDNGLYGYKLNDRYINAIYVAIKAIENKLPVSPQEDNYERD